MGEVFCWKVGKQTVGQRGVGSILVISDVPRKILLPTSTLLRLVMLTLQKLGKRAFGSSRVKGVKYDLAYCGTYFSAQILIPTLSPESKLK